MLNKVLTVSCSTSVLAQTYQLQAQCYNQQDDYSGAKAMFKKLVRVLKKCGQPCNMRIAEVYGQLVSCALRLGDLKKALKYSFKHIRWLKSTDSHHDQLPEALLL